MAKILGLQKTSLVDFAPYIAATIFIGGCNFRCGFCHNPSLVFEDDSLDDISESSIMSFLKERKGFTQAVCITGGEPTLYPGLKQLIKKIKVLGYKVKLDTNGSLPDTLSDLIKEDLLDYIAMDIKAPLDNYEKAAGVSINRASIQRSVDIIRNSGLGYEFRTTVVPDLLGAKDLIEIGIWLKGSKRFCLQQFRSGIVLSEEYKDKEPYKKEFFDNIQNVLKDYFDEVEVKGF